MSEPEPTSAVKQSDRRMMTDTDAVEAVLSTTISKITDGEFDQPRPGQAKLAMDVTTTISEEGGHLVGEAPTGVGKSIAYSAPLFVAAALRRERSVVATEGLALQTQLDAKDFPVLAEATEEVTGVKVSYTVLKGWSNYACAMRTTAAAEVLLEQHASSSYVASDLDGVSELARRVEEIGLKVDAEKATDGPARAGKVNFKSVLRRATDQVEIDGRQIPLEDMVQALRWALPASMGTPKLLPHADEATKPQTVRGEVIGDRHGAPVDISNDLWPSLSISSGACPGVKACEFGDQCRSAAARHRAANSDVVITNHAMLGIQATKSAKVVIGSTKLGHFTNIVIDEAHALPGIVRSQGASEVSAQRIERLTRRLEELADGSPANVSIIKGGLRLAGELELELSHAAIEANGGRRPRENMPVGVDAGSMPISDTYMKLIEWIESVSNIGQRTLGQWKKVQHRRKAWLKGRATLDRLTDLRQAIEDANDESPLIARWYETSDLLDGGRTIIKMSPVSVAPLLAWSVWTTERPEMTTSYGEAEDPSDSGDPNADLNDQYRKDVWTALATDEELEELDRVEMEAKAAMPMAAAGSPYSDPERFSLNVIALSATIPNNFAHDAGVKSRTERYESPFEVAYANSLAHVPELNGEERTRLISPFSKGKKIPGMDTKAHAEWVIDRIIELVAANEGHALVLAATTKSAQTYAAALKQHAEASGASYNVYSQWSQGTTTQVVKTWREDTSSVLVGTRGLMTGVDAPGQTCSLVIVDRIPRAAGNPVDDARVESICEEDDIDKWTADRQVYVADAAVLLEQAAGRLVRSVSDRGLLAIMDPRLIKDSGLSMSVTARKDYLDAVGAFDNRTRSHAKACNFLKGLAEERRAAEHIASALVPDEPDTGGDPNG